MVFDPISTLDDDAVELPLSRRNAVCGQIGE